MHKRTKEATQYAFLSPQMEEKEKQDETRCCFWRTFLEQVPAETSEGRGGLGSQFSILYKVAGTYRKASKPKSTFKPRQLDLCSRSQRPRLTCRGASSRHSLGTQSLMGHVYPQLEAFRLEVQMAFSRAASFSVIYLPSSPNLLSVAWS